MKQSNAGLRLMVILFALFSVAGGVVAQDAPLRVIASYSILADVAQQVAGDALEVQSLMPQGTDPHAFTPLPQEMVTLAQADVVFINGGGFEEGLMEALENAGDEMNLVTVSLCVPVRSGEAHLHDEDEHAHGDESATETDEHAHEESGEALIVDEALAALCEAHHAVIADLHAHGDEDMHDEAHGDEEAHEHDEHAHEAEVLFYQSAACFEVHDEHADEEHADEAHSDDAHEHGACDPHVWQDPHNVMLWALQVRDTLSTLDPANAELYAANTAAYLETLDALAHDFIKPAMESIPAENRVMVTNHENLGYFADAYGLEVVGAVIPSVSTGAEPSAQQIAALAQTIRETGARAVFAENTTNPQIASQVAAETGVPLITLYSDSLSATDGDAASYIAYMRYNVTAIVNALGGTLPAA